MKTFSAAVLAVALLLAPALACAAEETWLPIKPEDLALQDNPFSPGSSAMILYKEDTLDHQKNVREVFYRIKIFREEGMKYADIEIPYLRGKQEVKDLAARTIQPDGRVLEFRGVVYDKQLASARKLSYQAKTFTLSEVQPGSIIEYRYRLQGGGLESVWVVQEQLFLRQARLTLRPFKEITPNFNRRPFPFGAEFVKSSDGSWWVTLSNIPAFETETLMPPERLLQMRYHISYQHYSSRYPGQPINATGFWEEAGVELAKFVGKFAGKPDALRAVSQQLVSAQDPAETKLKKLYAAVQSKIRNLSYEESYSKKERKTENLKERKSAQDVWTLGYGSAEEITLLFVSLCRGAGFTCDPVYVSQRDSHIFDKEIMDPSQLDGQVVVVDLPGGARFLDPATRFAPFDLLAWTKQGVDGLRVGFKESRNLTTPAPRSEENIHERRITLDLQADGGAHIREDLRVVGQEAIDSRNDLVDLSAKQREHQLRKGFQEDFPDANITAVSWKGLEGDSGEVQFSYAFDIPGYAIPLAPRLLANPVIFPLRSPFPNWKRKYGVYFHYPYTRIDEVRVVPPTGFQLEQTPPEDTLTTAFGRYEMKVVADGGAISFNRKLILDGFVFGDTSAYNQLKSFFDSIQSRDQNYLVFRRQ